ncbi:hypothetical protein KFZ70_17040 [Tamlana fucoidanivorans]|uniref:Uncharacterized protein n=1 Tax=Allotamlana fucoidanivorans TaxID=2583814 RepID=A0A5C4SIE2_9FLAO|nr:hypothetical protein [Tamlana fucoidanivorans]TNJ43503.1 hypothetical protein FGF67_11330 [Tamlana fucoidanivorans]
MEQRTSVHIKLKEGEATNYMDAFIDKFGGKIYENRLIVESAKNGLQFSYYNFIEEFDLLVAQINFPKEIIVERMPDERPDYYHFNMINQGQIKQNYQDSLKYT